MIPNVLYPSLLKVCLQQIIRKYNFPHYQKGVISIKSGVTKSESFMWQILTPLLSDPFSTQFRYSALTPKNWLCRKNFSEEYRRSLAICLGLSVSPSICQWASIFYITQKATVRLCREIKICMEAACNPKKWQQPKRLINFKHKDNLKKENNLKIKTT